MAQLGSIKIPGVTDHYNQDVASQGRRVTGVTPKVVGAYQTRPYRYLKRATSLSTPSGGIGIKRLAKGTL